MADGQGPPGQSRGAPHPARISLAAPVGLGHVAEPGARRSRMDGALALTRGGVPIGCVAGLLVWASALGWRCRAIPCYGTWRQRGRRPVGGAAPAAALAPRRGVEGLAGRGRRDRAATCATAPKGRCGREGQTTRGGAAAAAATRPRGAGRRATLPRARQAAGGAGRFLVVQRCA